MPAVPPQKEYHTSLDKIWCVYAISVVSSWNAELVTYPLDLTKTRLQIQGEIANKMDQKLVLTPYRGMFSTAIGIIREEGFHKLWNGVHAAFARHFIYSGTRIVAYRALKEHGFKQDPHQITYFPIWKSAVCGVTAGGFAQFIASPTDLLKVQLQMEGKRRLLGLPARVDGLWDAFKKTVQAGGIRGLWKGSIPNVQRAALVNLGDLTTYDTAKKFILRNTSLGDNHVTHTLASFMAGFVAAAMGTPIDVVKTRIMNQPVAEDGRGLIYSSSWDCLKRTVQNEGPVALYKGFLPIWLRLAPWSLTFWLSFEEIVKYTGVSSKVIEKPKGKFSLRSLLFQRIFILQWLPKYTRSDVISDFIAGLTVGLTMMPQSIAYANLAGLPAQYGLYTAFVGSFTYVFFGTIKEVSIGPTSLMALLTFSYVEGLPVEFVLLLTFLVGCVELLMGIFKLGFLIEFISPCVNSGFTSAMAVVISVSQLKNLFGLRKLANHGFFDVLKQVAVRHREIQLGDTLLGFSCIAFLFAFKQLPKIKTKNAVVKKTLWFLSISKNAIVVLLTSLLGFYYFEYGGGVPFILSGAVPSGLPAVRPPNFSVQVGNETLGFFDMVGTLGSSIVVIPVAAVLANVAIAKAFATGVIVDATQEMMTLGLCNIFGSFVQAMPSCGAFTRSAVANSSGVRTPLQGIYSGTIIILALSFLTPYFYYIPRATLAAVLISAVITMFDYEIFPKLWKCNRFDFFLTLGTLTIGICYGVEVGIVAGSIANLAILLKGWARPRIITEIRSDNKGNDYVYIKPELGLYYPAVDYLTTTVAEAHNFASDLQIVVDCSSIINIDYAGCQMVNNMLKLYNKNYQKLTLQKVNPNVFRILKEQIDFDNVHVCQSHENLCERSFAKHNSSEIPLLAVNNNETNERKLSCYDNV